MHYECILIQRASVNALGRLMARMALAGEGASLAAGRPAACYRVRLPRDAERAIVPPAMLFRRSAA